MALFSRIASAVGWDSGRRMNAALASINANFALLEPGVTVASGTAYTLALGDKVVSRSNAGAQTVTVPANASVEIPIGSKIDVIQTGAGALTIAAAGGVTINKLAARTLVVAGQYGRVTLTKISANVWNANGDLT